MPIFHVIQIIVNKDEKIILITALKTFIKLRGGKRSRLMSGRNRQAETPRRN